LSRVALAVAGAVLLSGCFHFALVEQQRAVLLEQELKGRLLPMTLEEARAVVLRDVAQGCGALGVSRRPADCELAVDVVEPKRWRFCRDACCATLVARPDGVELVDVAAPFSGVSLPDCRERMWLVLDPLGAAAVLRDLPDRAEEAAIDLERHFPHRWAFTGAVFASLTTPSAFSLGAHVGVRRWISPYLIPGATVGFEHQLTATPRELISLRPRIELTTWTPEADRMGLPGVSMYLFVAPQLVVGGGEVNPGFQAGVGVIVRLGFFEIGGATDVQGPHFRIAAGAAL
jgi:hypothetical protein